MFRTPWPPPKSSRTHGPTTPIGGGRTRWTYWSLALRRCCRRGARDAGSRRPECRCEEHCVRRWAVASRGVLGVILPRDRDPRFVTIRRGGTLTESDHQLLALWAASCAKHVLDLFESAQPGDQRPRRAIDEARAWVRGEITMRQARTPAGHANAAARDLIGAARHAAYAAGQAAPVAQVPAPELWVAATAIQGA